MAKQTPNSKENSNPYPKFDADAARQKNVSKLSDTAVQYHDDCLKQLDQALNKQGGLPKE